MNIWSVMTAITGFFGRRIHNGMISEQVIRLCVHVSLSGEFAIIHQDRREEADEYVRMRRTGWVTRSLIGFLKKVVTKLELGCGQTTINYSESVENLQINRSIVNFLVNSWSRKTVIESLSTDRGILMEGFSRHPYITLSSNPEHSYSDTSLT